MIRLVCDSHLAHLHTGPTGGGGSCRAVKLITALQITFFSLYAGQMSLDVRWGQMARENLEC